jgi:predicted permease
MKRWFPRVRHVRSDADVKDELRVHLDMQTEDNAATGLTPAEAARRAHVALGRVPAIVEAVHDQDLMTMLESWYRDFRLGLRALRKSPVFSLTAILTIALGIGANTAIFTLLYGLILRSLPVSNPGQLAWISIVSAWTNSSSGNSGIPYRMLAQLQQVQHSFVGISAWRGIGVSMVDSDGTIRLFNAATASGNAFSLLGTRPYLGRLIAPDDDIRGGPATGWPVVIDYGFWNERFGADPEIVGKHIQVSGIPVTVVGVTPPEFHGATLGGDKKMYFPFQFTNALLGKDVLNAPGSHYMCYGLGRLKPGVSLSEAAAEIASYQGRLLREFIPIEEQRTQFFEKARLKVASARSGLPAYEHVVYGEPLWIMQGLVFVVLILCCVNVAGMMMAKVQQRQREFAVRTAIGAARWRLIRQYLIESLVIGFAGAALGALAAWYGSPAMLRFFRDPMMGAPISVRPDRMVFWVTGLCAIGTTLLFGTLPAWRAGKSDPASLLTSRTAAGVRRHATGRTFVPLQVALSLVLVAFATLLSQNLIRLRSDRTGFDVDHVTIQTAPFDLFPKKGNAKLDLYQRMVDRLDQMPGIRSAAVTLYTPMTGFDARGRFQALTGSVSPPEDSHMAYNAVGPGYFRTMQTHIIEGREFEKNERTPSICILNRSAANYLFPHEEALGRYVRGEDLKEFPDAGPLSCRVIGIAEDAKFASVREPAPRTIYFPVSTKTVTWLVFLINSETKAQAIAGYRKALSEIAPTVPLNLFATLREQMDAALGSEELTATLSDLFSGLALFLSALGLYGLLSSSVVQRTSEIGVRIAFGASRRQILRMILLEAARLVAVGAFFGGLALLLALRFLRGMLFGISTLNPIALAACVILLLIVTVIAAAPPALRAAAVDPVEALRAE